MKSTKIRGDFKNIHKDILGNKLVKYLNFNSLTKIIKANFEKIDKEELKGKQNNITPPEIIQEMLKKAVNKAIEEYNNHKEIKIWQVPKKNELGFNIIELDSNLDKEHDGDNYICNNIRAIDKQKDSAILFEFDELEASGLMNATKISTRSEMVKFTLPTTLYKTAEMNDGMRTMPEEFVDSRVSIFGEMDYQLF